MNRTAKQESIDKNVSGALLLLAVAEMVGDDANIEVAHGVLRECGYPNSATMPLANAVRVAR